MNKMYAEALFQLFRSKFSLLKLFLTSIFLAYTVRWEDPKTSVWRLLLYFFYSLYFYAGKEFLAEIYKVYKYFWKWLNVATYLIVKYSSSMHKGRSNENRLNMNNLENMSYRIKYQLLSCGYCFREKNHGK